jgi:hypothetical protein
MVKVLCSCVLCICIERERERERESEKRERACKKYSISSDHLKNIISNADADGTWRVYLEGHKWKERVRKEQKKISYTYMFTQVHVYILEQHS